MGVSKPYKRTFRPFVGLNYSSSTVATYIRDPKYATAPKQYVRAFLIIQKDMIDIFDFIEPADRNADTYSYRTHALLMRTCIEIEANFKAIFYDNEYAIKRELCMDDYRLANKTHRLSSYKVMLRDWRGRTKVRRPYLAWTSPTGSLPWYQAYNASKHDRHKNFYQASFNNLIESICGLLVLLSAQFFVQDFTPDSQNIGWPVDPTDEFKDAIGGYFRVRFPDDWLEDEMYDFDWDILQTESNPFGNLRFLPPVIHTYIAGLKSHDVAKIATTVADDLAFVTPARTLTKPQFLAFLVALYDGFPDWRYDHDPPEARPDGTVAVRWRQGGTHTRTLALPGFDPVPPTGRTVAIPEHHFFYRVAGGLIAEIRPDPVPGGAPRGIFEQIGVALPPL